MARDSDGLPVRKWAKSETALALAPTDITPADGLPASYGVDSFISLEVFNYLWRQVTALGEDVAKHGVLEWDASQEYLHPSFVIGSDNNLYQSVQANTAQDPTIDDDGTYWTPASSLDIANASETVPGIIRTATTAEVLAGTTVSTAVTPADLAAVTAELLSTAVDGLTSEPGEYVLARDDGGRTWPWNTTKGRAVLDYEPTVTGVVQENFLQNVPGGSGSFNGVATDGETIWFLKSATSSLYIDIFAWTIDGSRNADKDIRYLKTAISSSAGIVVYGDNLFVVSGYRAGSELLYPISIADATYGTIGSPIGILPSSDLARGVTTDGDTIWVVSKTDNSLIAYSGNGTRLSAMDIDLSSVAGDFYGAATDGTTIWVSDLSSTDRYLRAWNIATKAHDSDNDISFAGAGITIDNTFGTALDFYDSVLYIDTGRNVSKYQLPKPRKLTVGNTIYETVGQNEVTGASIGDTIRADLQEDDDFAIVYPVY